MAERLTIGRLGARGDGIAETPAGPVYVPFALPGETVLAERDGEHAGLIAVATASAERRAPISPYFTRCGGCVAQHMNEPLYRRWKSATAAEALARAGIKTELEDLIDAHGAGRRRVVFHARIIGDKMRVGFMAARSHTLVPIDQCPILAPGLAGAPQVALRLAKLPRAGGKPLDVQLTATPAGLDVDIRGLGKAGPGLTARLIQAADRLDLARLSLHGEVLVERRPPALRMGRAVVVPPPGGFLQPTEQGEAILASLVTRACGGAKRIADLFAGCGAFSLRLAERAEVHAVENDAAARAALDKAARGTPGLRTVTSEARDLFRRPLLAPELDRFDAAVLDPPRAGGEAQVRRLAEAKLRLVVMVSCDAGTFARDARLLVEGGFEPLRITPVDQFRYAAPIELVGIFARAPGRRGR